MSGHSKWHSIRRSKGILDQKLPWALVLLGLYPLQMLRLYRGFKGPIKVRAARAAFMVMGKFAEACGQIKFVWLRLSGRTARLIEYK